MPRYPERAIPTNGWQAAGQAAQDLGQQLGDFSDRQARLRASFQAMLDRRKDKAMRDMEAADRTRREEAELQLRKDKESREAQAPKEWKPQSMEDAVEFERKKAEAINASKPSPRPSDGDINRQQRRAKAIKAIPLLWSEIENAQDMPMQIDPNDPAFAAWEKRLRDLKSRLNQEELEAGLTPSTAIAGNLDGNQSYRLYRGMRGDTSEAPRPAQPAPQAPARKPADEASAAEDWLARNPNHPKAAEVRAKLDSLRGRRGL